MALVTTQNPDAKEVELDLFSADTFSSASIICKSPDKLKDVVNALDERKAIQFISKGDWSTNDLVMMLLKRWCPADLYFSTYAIRETPIRQLILAKERKQLIRLFMLIDNRAKIRTPEVFQLAEMNATRIALTSVHAKVCVLKTANQWITINGSSNWTNNPRIESGVITMNKEVAEFHISWIKKVMYNAEVFK